MVLVINVPIAPPAIALFATRSFESSRKSPSDAAMCSFAVPESVTQSETGFLVPPADPDKMAEGLLKLAQDPELRVRMGLAGRKRVEEFFDMDRQNAKLLKLIKNHCPAQASS